MRSYADDDSMARVPAECKIIDAAARMKQSSCMRHRQIKKIEQIQRFSTVAATASGLLSIGMAQIEMSSIALRSASSIGHMNPTSIPEAQQCLAF